MRDGSMLQIFLHLMQHFMPALPFHAVAALMGLHVLNQTTHANLHEEVPVIAALQVHAQ